MRILKRIFITVGALLGIFLVAGVVLAYVYEDEVKTYALGRLSDYFVTEVSVYDVQLSLVSKFPMASLEFTDVMIRDAYKDTTIQRDTLFQAKHLFLEFNIVDLFNSNYTIRSVEIEEGELTLKVNEDGEDNFHFWKASEDTAGGFAFALEDFVTDGLDISYVNKQTNQDYSFKRVGMALKGDFVKENFSLQGHTDCFVEHFIADSLSYMKERPVQLSVLLDVDTKTNRFRVEDGHLKVEELLFDLDGEVLVGEETMCDLAIKGKDIDIQELYSVLPDNVAGKLNNYKSNGDLEFVSTIVGNVTGENSPEITALFSVEDGSLTHKSTDITLKKLKFQGRYTKEANVTRADLNIEGLSASLGDGSITASINVADFENPKLKIDIAGNLNLTDLQAFIQLDTIEHISGRIGINTSFEGNAAALKNFTAEYFKRSKASGEVQFAQTSVRFKGHPMEYKNVNGIFVLKNNDAAIKDLTGLAAGSDFKLNGFFRNFLGFLFLDNEKLTIEASFDAEKLDLNQLLTMEGGTDSDEGNYHLSLPEHVNCNLRARIGTLAFRQFEATDIRGIVRLKDRQLHFDDVTFNNADGKITVAGTVDGHDPAHFILSCTANVAGIDVQKSFSQFENFGQDFITDRHLRGTADATIDFAAAVSENLEFDRSKLFASADIELHNGELIDFETMHAVTDFMKSNKLLSSLVDVDAFGAKLHHIKFSELKNRIEIRDQMIYIPQMQISSSAMDINMSGEHGFDNSITYNFDFKIDEVFKRKNTRSEFGEIEDDGTGASIFLTMTGTTSDYEFAYDRKGARERFREDLAEEKQTLKAVLKTEFGLFGRDTAVQTLAAPTTPAPEFIIEWEEFDEAPEQDPDGTEPAHRPLPGSAADADPDGSSRLNPEKKKKKNNNSKFNKFLQKLEESSGDETEVDLGFELEDQLP
jgi:hypothetical protein